jgi:hypothetical protein
MKDEATAAEAEYDSNGSPAMSLKFLAFTLLLPALAGIWAIILPKDFKVHLHMFLMKRIQ